MSNSYLKTIDNDYYRQRLSGPLIFILLAFAILGTRLFYLQIIEGESYYTKSENNCIRLQRIPPERGLIYDQNGELLVDNRPSFDIEIVPKDARPYENVLPDLSRYLNVPKAELIAKLKKARGSAAYRPVILKRDVSRDVLAQIEVNRYDLPGVQVQVIPRRHYVQRTAVHLVGYLGEISGTELRKKGLKEYRQGDYIGKYGVEKEFENYLRGKPGGRQVEVDVNGRVLKVNVTEKPSPGHNVYLTIDAELQKKAESLLEGQSGAIVAIDPNTGMILSFVSKPDYDPNIFVDGMSHDQWNKLVNDYQKPLHNKVLQGEYPPGSIYKIVTAIAGLEEKIVSLNEKIECIGHYRLGNRSYRCWKKYGHGWMNIEDAIGQSCDVYFYQLGLQLGVDRLAKYAKACGLGKKTGSGLELERPGLIPTSKWKLLQTGEVWQKGETLSIAIGQGYNLVTPIQALCLIAAVANGGIMYQPQVIKSIQTVTGKSLFEAQRKAMGRLPASPKTLQILKKGLWEVVNKTGGTAYWHARDKTIEISGKTGTAQVISLKNQEEKEPQDKSRYEDHAWFVAYAPSIDSRIAVAVLVEHGGHGSSAAAPIAKEIIKAYLGREK
ncbi:MAG: penicillin-binding protein 2 [Candidatus Magnetomorum sp.]|nr:penicillin-binding protein 2 [Candidatus Magnetomorum sp.]MBF0452001.1 penicillin-binding protein 2 [Candidatus Magnetomorum sp.]